MATQRNPRPDWPAATIGRRMDAVSAVIRQMVDGIRPTTCSFDCPTCSAAGLLRASPVPGDLLGVTYKCGCLSFAMHARRWAGCEVILVPDDPMIRMFSLFDRP